MRPKFASTSVIILQSLVSVASAKEPPLPIPSGIYTFQHKYAEQPDMPSFALTATIKGRRIALVNKTESQVFPKGEIASGTLMWHTKSKQ